MFMCRWKAQGHPILHMQRSEDNLWYKSCLLLYLGQGLLLSVLAYPMCVTFQDSPVPAFHLNTEATGLPMCGCVLWHQDPMGSGDLNPCLHICSTVSLPTDLSPRALVITYLCTVDRKAFSLCVSLPLEVGVGLSQEYDLWHLGCSGRRNFIEVPSNLNTKPNNLNIKLHCSCQ